VNFLRLLPAFLSALLLGAHFLRAGTFAFVFITLAGPLILLIHRPWVARAVQIGLIAGGVEWARTLVQLVLARQAVGESWTRLALILGGVTVLTACSALVFRLSALRKLYGLGSGKGSVRGGPRSSS